MSASPSNATSNTRSPYLNAILTVNAVLLASILWTNVAGQPSTASAYAAPQSTQNEGGVPNAGLQRLDILNELRAINAEVQQLTATVNGGRTRVIIANVEDFKIDYAKLRDAVKGTQSPPPPPTGSVAPAAAGAPAVASTPGSSITPVEEPARP